MAADEPARERRAGSLPRRSVPRSRVGPGYADRTRRRGHSQRRLGLEVLLERAGPAGRKRPAPGHRPSSMIRVPGARAGAVRRSAVSSRRAGRAARREHGEVGGRGDVLRAARDAAFAASTIASQEACRSTWRAQRCSPPLTAPPIARRPAVARRVGDRLEGGARRRPRGPGQAPPLERVGPCRRSAVDDGDDRGPAWSGSAGRRSRCRRRRAGRSPPADVEALLGERLRRPPRARDGGCARHPSAAGAARSSARRMTHARHHDGLRRSRCAARSRVRRSDGGEHDAGDHEPDAATVNASWKPSTSAACWSLVARARRRGRSGRGRRGEAASDERTASPSAPPTCCEGVEQARREAGVLGARRSSSPPASAART